MDYKDEARTLPVTLPGVPADKVGGFFTLREGGISAGPYGTTRGIMGWNVGTRVGDAPACVAMNRRFVSSLVPSEPRWMHQVAGTRVVDGESIGEENATEADAATSVTPGVVLAIQVADCLPVLIADQAGRGIAAAHAGWRGLVGGVIENAVDALRTRLQDPKAPLSAWLGPRIGFAHFEVGPEVVEAFQKAYPQVNNAVRPGNPGKFYLDLGAYARAALASRGVTAVDDCEADTFGDPERFYSFRRDGARTGRHAALLWLK